MKLACKLGTPLPVILVRVILGLLSGQIRMGMILAKNPKPKARHCHHITNFLRKHLKGEDMTGLKVKIIMIEL